MKRSVARVTLAIPLLLLLQLSSVLPAAGQHRAAAVGDGGLTHAEPTAPGTAGPPTTYDPDALTTVIVRFADTSVATSVSDALKAGKAAPTAAERTITRANLMARQDSNVLALRNLGATVGNRFVDALNAATIVVRASDVGRVRALPGVLSVSGLRVYQPDNDNSDTFTKVKDVWSAVTPYTGTGEKIAMIDTGIDYKHADFGGTSASTFPTAKVIGGTDLVGDTYNASSATASVRVPHPDNDPMDCEGHGTHTAGTAAGQGVDSAGNAYNGPYDNSVAFNTFKVAPGAAPTASLLAYKVFGCAGGVDNAVLLDALNRAVAAGANVINMSLGSEWGRNDDPDSVAADNAVAAGAVVVISAGNAGHQPYLVGGPSTGDRVMSVAAVDATQSNLMATISKGATTINAIDANRVTGANVVGQLHVISGTEAGGLSLGCSASDYSANGGSAGTIVVVVRGTCARAAKPVLAQAAGAVATIMINNAAGLPPDEGAVPGLTTPFLGIDPADQATLIGLDGQTVTLALGIPTPNPTLGTVASFSSGGPRSGDSAQKPDVSAPGVAVLSAAVGTGNGGVVMSGTSMAAPHTAGVAALVRQAHPTWTADQVKAAIVNTAAAGFPTFDPRLYGAGWVRASDAVATTVVATTDDGNDSINFGIIQGVASVDRTFTLTNTGAASLSYNLSVSWSSPTRGAVISLGVPATTVAAHSSVTVTAHLDMSAASLAALPGADNAGIVTLDGLLRAVPAAGPSLSVPFIATPHGRSRITASPTLNGNTFTVTNKGIHSGRADVYAWLLYDGLDRGNRADARGLGVKYVDEPSNDKAIYFAFNLNAAFGNPTEDIFEVFLDTTGDGVADDELFAADAGLVTAGGATGVMGMYLYNLHTQQLNSVGVPDARFGGTTAVIGVFASDLGLTQGGTHSALVVQALVRNQGDQSTDVIGTSNAIAPPKVIIEPWNPQMSTGETATLAPGASASITVTSRAPTAGQPTDLGWMVVGVDDVSGQSQADLVRQPRRRHN